MHSGFLAGLTLCAALPATVAAQIDFRNLDDDRPLAVEDAYPIEHYAFEFLLPYGFQRENGASLHALIPELAWGALPNLHLGIKLPLATLDAGAGESGVAGARGFLLYNLFTESPALPALGLRADLSLPVGSLGGRGARGALSLLATRSFGAFRVHGNAGLATADPDRPAAVEPIPRWRAGVALDRTFFRHGLLLAMDLTARRQQDQALTEFAVGAGLRWQWQPTLVLDLGVSRRLSRSGPDLGFTLGLSHAFAIRALMPGHSVAREAP